MYIIGIDPGASGGIAVIPLYDFRSTRVYPLEDYSLTTLCGIFQELRDGNSENYAHNHAEVYIENSEGYSILQNPLPLAAIYLEEPQLPQFNTHTGGNFNVQAHKKLARSLGQLEGICIAFGYPPILLSPRKWQNALKCPTGGDKNISKNLAIKVFPFLSKTMKTSNTTAKYVSTITHSVADALLIALYGYLEYQIPKFIPLTVKNNVPTIEYTRKIPRKKRILSKE